MPQSHQNWQYLGSNGYVGAYTTTGGGGTPVIPRSDMDYLRLGIGKTPEAEYPDGYLGTIRSRRDDRGRASSTSDTVLDSLKARQNQRGYQRGVHKGERIESNQYFWPQDFLPSSRLKQEKYTATNINGGINMLVNRHAPKSNLAPAPHLVNDGKANISATVPGEFNPTIARQFSHLKPKWN
jgi:hypothetical protein